MSGGRDRMEILRPSLEKASKQTSLLARFFWRKGQESYAPDAFLREVPKQTSLLARFFWRKGQDSNLRSFRLLVFKTSAINHSATLPL